MLLLVFTDGNQVSLIQQNVRSHERGVGEQTAVDVFGVLCALVLELGHTGQLAEHGVALQDPAQFAVLRNVALDEQSVLFGVQTAGDVLCQLVQGAAAQGSGILTNGQGVQVSHEVIAVKPVCQLCPVLHCAQIVAQMQVTGRLNAGYHYLLFDFVHFIYLLNRIDGIADGIVGTPLAGVRMFI